MQVYEAPSFGQIYYIDIIDCNLGLFFFPSRAVPSRFPQRKKRDGMEWDGMECNLCSLFQFFRKGRFRCGTVCAYCYRCMDVKRARFLRYPRWSSINRPANKSTDSRVVLKKHCFL